MKKIILYFLVIFIFSQSVFGTVINCEIEYNVQKASEEVFKSQANLNVSNDLINKYLYDPNYTENTLGIKNNITTFSNRIIGQFSDNTYGVMYLNNQHFYWFYNSRGELISYSIKEKTEYPTKITKYKPNGSIINTGLKISNNESYIFKKNGELIGHWINNKCYDANNNIILIRSKI